MRQPLVFTPVTAVPLSESFLSKTEQVFGSSGRQSGDQETTGTQDLESLSGSSSHPPAARRRTPAEPSEPEDDRLNAVTKQSH